MNYQGSIFSSLKVMTNVKTIVPPIFDTTGFKVGKNIIIILYYKDILVFKA